MFWALAWVGAHAAGLAIMLTLWSRSRQQVRVARRWRARKAGTADQEESIDLVVMAEDRHRLYSALTLAAGGYLLLGLIVVSMPFLMWLSLDVYRTLTRAILVGGEAIWIVAAWLSVRVGDRLARAKVEQQKP